MTNKSVRLHHPAYANVNYVVELPQEMPLEARACNACSQPDRPVVHRFKSIHLRLDSNGDVFVAPGILELLRQVPGMAGLEVSNTLDNAPNQRVGAVEMPTQEVMLADRRFYVPGRTQQEAERKVQKPFKDILEPLLERYDRKVTAEQAEKKSTFIFGKRKIDG